MKTGIEIEFLVAEADGSNLVFPGDYGFNTDEFCILGEIRTKPYDNPYLTIGELIGLIKDAERKAGDKGLELVFTPTRPISKELRVAINKRPDFHKGQELSENLYGKSVDPFKKEIRAGIHIHFSSPRIISYHIDKETKEIEVFDMFDMVRIIRAMDSIFAKEIKKAGRLPGEYEMKPHGFEYRSLPNNTNRFKLARALQVVTTTKVWEEEEFEEMDDGM